MKPYEELLLKLIRSAVLQKQEDFSEFSDFADWGNLFALSSSHSVVGMIYDKMIEVFDGKIPEKYAIWFKHSAFKEMSFQAVRSLTFASIYEELKKKNIAPVVLKGEVLRRLYPKPESRTSLDEDLLIEPEDYEPLKNELVSMGFEEAGEGRDEKHWVNKKYSVYFEIHFSPFPTEKSYESWNRIFDNYKDRSMVNENGVVSLSRTDNFIYLFLHAAIHFIYSGVGIKQLLDIALFIKKYKDEIDFKYAETMLKKAKAFNFAAEITAFIKKYFCEDVFTFTKKEVDESFAQDVFSSGSLGKSDKDRIHSANVTSTKFTGKSSLKKILFPPKKRLQIQYPFAKKYPFLLPVAWLLRLLSNLTHGKRSLQTGNERLKLIKKYGLITKKTRSDNDGND